jgi:hypothetical protein
VTTAQQSAAAGHAAELRYCAVSRPLLAVANHPKLVEFALKLALKLEGGAFISGSAREIMRRRFGVSIGPHRCGEWFTPGQFQRNSVVGRCASISPGVRTYLRHHPTQTLSTHPYVFNSRLGFTERDTMAFGHLVMAPMHGSAATSLSPPGASVPV